MDNISSAIETFKSITKHPESFLKQQNEKAKKIQQEMLENIYTCCRDLQKGQKRKALPKLITNGMDVESIWQQLEIQNEENFQLNIKDVSKFLAVNSDKFKINLGDMSDDDEENGSNEEQDDESDENEQASDNELDEQEEENNSELDEQEEDDDSELDEENTEQVSKKKFKGKKSIVDDEFFKLSEMEHFLKDQESRDMNKGAPNEEDIDYFAEDNDEINLEESLRYSDFFDHDDDPEEDDGEESNNEEAEEDPNEPKSSHEVRQERLKKKIEKMEEDMLEKKSWQMKGEIKAETRPQNSLLEEVLEFDSATRPAPVITESVSMRLEDIIKQRIKDKAFDDVERKVKPSDIQYEYKKQVVLDQEKSKQSLAQLYEKEYLKELEKADPNAADVEEEEPKAHKEIRAELKDLFEKLDMLSNFYYTPRPAQPELKIITNLPTIAMEEVAPVATNDATLLAPEEIKRKVKGGNIIGEGERTATDKKRERRHKKQFQQNKFSKEKTTDKTALVNKVMKSRNVEKIKSVTDDSMKSSSAFFNKLQDEASQSLNKNRTKLKRKRDKPVHQAKKLKL
ncbi:U3 small nucleolar ribonucleoprotein protein MPP10 [Chironomus tepperi]|uniref:U3 small nucleolar ribonucleoprotein protein MPP10 n=1 Tax=Chironomus tepperi TaxID=113505 RepID=UPI00391FBFEC